MAAIRRWSVWTGGRTLLRILSNLADRRVMRARATWPCAAIGGAEVRDAMISAYQFADNDPYRAAPHNKGIMNGISAVVQIGRASCRDRVCQYVYSSGVAVSL